MKQFELVSEFSPSGDQPNAIHSLVAGLNSGKPFQTLLGVTGSGKTYTIANMIKEVNRPTLVLAHNKTLAAQLCAEFRALFPNNAVEYFVSYYDYYQPEAYVAHRDLYIEKEAQINEDIERLRHSATRSLLSRRDVIIVSSVSCIYGLGTPEEYARGVITLNKGDIIPRRQFLLELEQIQYERNDIELKSGRYRVKGETIDLLPSWETNAIRLEFFGDELERIRVVHPISGEVLDDLSDVAIFPATHYVVLEGIDEPIKAIRAELKGRLAELEADNKIVEAQRLAQRTRYDLEMMREMGYCKGIENYARHLSGGQPGEPPGVLLDFFPKDFVVVVDESHVTLPQLHGMYKGDRSRKQNLVDFGFRLPSAMDNRPLKFEEFLEKVNQVVYVSATPGEYEVEVSGDIVEQIIRPTGLVDPEVDIRPSEGQVDDLLGEINKRVEKNERVLVTTVTKQFSEDLADYLSNKGVKVRYLHSDIMALERVDILHDLRVGVFDVLVGVNLLREGLDLPEVSLVAILDADKEGFLRNERSLIQTMGRAARNVEGRVVMYADVMTNSIKKAVSETNRRRAIQLAYNKEHGIVPKSTTRSVNDIRDGEREKIKALANVPSATDVAPEALPVLLAVLEKQMEEAAENLEFEVAAVLRDRINELQQS
ncbi:MAG: excinuclease ABC subunit UvrB [bacterium]|nr:excinuclease ABC subunit UvrB [bacterium]